MSSMLSLDKPAHSLYDELMQGWSTFSLQLNSPEVNYEVFEVLIRTDFHVATQLSLPILV